MKRLLEISKMPAKDPGEWLSSAEDSVEFLKENEASDWIVVYASLSCVFIHAVLAPLKHLDPAITPSTVNIWRRAIPRTGNMRSSRPLI
jgi:hypothetical protein